MKSDKNKNIAIISIPSIESLEVGFFLKDVRIRFTDRLNAPEGTMVFANVILRNNSIHPTNGFF